MNYRSPMDIQRLRYSRGQLLKSRDLRDQIRYNALLQAWHNRAFHDSYGVRSGLQVSLLDDHAVIQPGLAYDTYGRALVLSEERRWQLPKEIPAGGLYLVAQLRTTDESACGPARSDIMGVPVFCWQDAYQFDTHWGVPLARLLAGPKLDENFILPVTRPEAQPRRFYTDTLPGSTPWRIWELPLKEVSKTGIRFLGLEVDVDTSAAGFTQTPCYFAWLSGDLWSSDLPGKLESSDEEGRETAPTERIGNGLLLIQYLVLRFGHIAQPTSNRFTYRLWMPRAAASIAMESRLFALVPPNRLTLNWLGIETDHDVKENYELTG